jgi:Major Facilitator Superfamily
VVAGLGHRSHDRRGRARLAGIPGLLALTALAFALVAVPLLLLGATPAAPPRAASADAATRLTRPMLLAAASFTLFHTAMLSGSVVLPLYLTLTLERPDRDVGLLFSVCALVEVPAALSLTLLPARVRKQWVILLGMVLFVAYFLLVAASSSMPLLIGTQVARGVAIAVVGALGITYVQDLLPRATGRATAAVREHPHDRFADRRYPRRRHGPSSRLPGGTAAVRRPQRRRVRAVGQRPAAAQRRRHQPGTLAESGPGQASREPGRLMSVLRSHIDPNRL